MKTAMPYQTLVQSAASLVDVEQIADLDFAAGDVSAVSAFLQRNRAALEVARRTLGPQCVVPVRYDASFFSDSGACFLELRNLARAFQAEGWLAACNGDYPAAARIGLEIFELANSVRRGGLIVDLMLSSGVSRVATKLLRQVRTRFDQATRESIIRELLRLETQRESFSEIVARDRAWELAVDWHDKPCNVAELALSDPEECGLSEEEQRELFQVLEQMASLPDDELRQLELDQERRGLAMMRMLAIELALQEWHASSGSYPERLSSLTLELLPELPTDPFTEAPFIYRRVGDASFSLYSTGPKGRDGGGQIGPWPLVAAGEADLFLDASDYALDII